MPVLLLILSLSSTPKYSCAALRTPKGTNVHSVGIVKELSNNTFAVFQFKDSYEDEQLDKYKNLRIKLHSPYTI